MVTEAGDMAQRLSWTAGALAFIGAGHRGDGFYMGRRAVRPIDARYPSGPMGRS
ncbi:MAG TPA: hypothetical protein VD887_05045 [Allosphingosinicella sp.]|nr:hypothetical protein [Allosphingosinicella sp.]